MKITLIDESSLPEITSDASEVGGVWSVLVEGLVPQQSNKVQVLFDGHVMDTIDRAPYVRHYNTGLAPISAHLLRNIKGNTISVHVYPTAPAAAPPVAPADVVAYIYNTNENRVFWSDPNATETGYTIEAYNPLTGQWSVVGTVGENVTEFYHDIS